MEVVSIEEFDINTKKELYMNDFSDEGINKYNDTKYDEDDFYKSGYYNSNVC